MKPLIAVISLPIPFSICANDAILVAKIQHWQTHNGANAYFVYVTKAPMVYVPSDILCRFFFVQQK